MFSTSELFIRAYDQKKMFQQQSQHATKNLRPDPA